MKRSRSVRVHVARLVVATALPFLVFGALLLIHSADNEQRIISTTVSERAQGAAADLDRELRNLQDLVSTLASSHHLFGSAPGSRHHAVSLLRAAALGLVVRDLSGETLLDTCTESGRPIPITGAVNNALHAARWAQPQISKLAAEPIDGEFLLTIDLPVWRDDETVSILSLCVLPRILRVLLEQHLPVGWSALIADSQGRPIASVKASAGTSYAAAGGDWAALARGDGRVYEWGSSGSGYSASSTVDLAQWTVSVAIPSGMFFAPMRHAVFTLLVVGGGLVALVLVLAFAIGGHIAGSLTHLTAIGKSLRSGRPRAVRRTGITEADLVAEVLCATGEDLNRRTVELVRTVDALRHRKQRLRKLSDDLRQALDEREELLSRIVSVQEGERQRVARELHDNLGQYLVAMLLGLSAIEKAESWRREGRHRIADLKTITSAMSREVHRLAWELRPAVLDDLGLEAAIANYLEKWSGRFDLNVDFVGNLRGKRLAPPVETTLYRVLQEAMTNIAKHAQAQRVSVILEAETDEVRLIVEDDGIGLAQAGTAASVEPAGRFGLLGIRERLALIGGSFHIERASDHGTALFCRVPA